MRNALTELIQEIAGSRRKEPVSADQFKAVSERYHQLVSTGFAYADTQAGKARSVLEAAREGRPFPMDSVQPVSEAELRAAAIGLAAAALRLAAEGSEIFHYQPTDHAREAAHAS